MSSRGMALVTGLLLLLAISVIAVAAAGGMALQQHQATNHEDRARAASGADLASSYGVAWLFSRQGLDREPGCSDRCLLPAGIHRAGTLPDRPEFETAAWWGQKGNAVDDSPGAFWLIEEIHYETPPTDTGPGTGGIGYYRILGRGSGVNPGSVAVNESIVARQWGDSVQANAFPPAERLNAFCDRLENNWPCGTLSWRRRR